MSQPSNLEDPIVVVSDGRPLPAWLEGWLGAVGGERLVCPDAETVHALALRGRPRAIVIDAVRLDAAEALALCERLKEDAWTAIVPLLLLTDDSDVAIGLDAGADEVLTPSMPTAPATARLHALLRRSDRDTDVHPSTRLPGARGIEAELAKRISAQAPFAACYADLDHFKEFNDRYGFHQGNGVIQLVARLLHDVVKGLCGHEGFVGHIGGDDFLYIVPTAAMPRVCDEVVRVFDELAPMQYSDGDRRAGYFMGKDRRNQLYRVPLMTLSIGVVTNQRRRFTRPAEVSELATEMKSYAKTLPGSVWSLDRRRDDEATEAGAVVRERTSREAAPRDASARESAVSGGATVLPLRPRNVG